MPQPGYATTDRTLASIAPRGLSDFLINHLKLNGFADFVAFMARGCYSSSRTSDYLISELWPNPMIIADRWL